MPRLLHTADWQLGMKLRFVPGDRGAQLRAERFEVVRRIAALAHEHAVDTVLVAGDVFDDNAVGPHTLERARDVLREMAPIPVVLLPGNHDAATPGCALDRLKESGPGLDHVQVCLGRDPIDLDGLRVYPCPLFERHSADDPTAHLEMRDPADPVRVALAHGGALEFDESTETPNKIDVFSLVQRGFDYVALGDWHGTLSMDPRIWYAGAPEPTGFKDNDAGNALLVDIERAGAVPAVTKHAVARTRWQQLAETLESEADVDALLKWLERLPQRSWSLVELLLSGSLPLAARARLEQALEEHAEQLLYLRVRDELLHTRAETSDLEALRAEGFVGAAVERLRAEEGRESEDAMQLLYRFVTEEAGRSRS